MTTAQVLFSIALALVSLIIVGFAIYVLSTTIWGDRWVRSSRSIAKDEPRKDES